MKSKFVRVILSLVWSVVATVAVNKLTARPAIKKL